MRVLLDSTVLIDFLRGDERARTFIRSLTLRPYLSAMTVAELYRGIREGK
jgi:predicted nucleic acid-binding protein